MSSANKHFFGLIECRSVTDSVGSHSDISGHTLQAANGMMTRPHMDVVCVIDICQSGNLAHRKKALDEVNQACVQVGATLNHIQVVCT
jgi:mitogen-activated protein kinase kinase kinase 5